MGSFLEKNIDWEKEAERMEKFLDKINNYILEQEYYDDLFCSKANSILKESRHFKKLFKE